MSITINLMNTLPRVPLMMRNNVIIVLIILASLMNVTGSDAMGTHNIRLTISEVNADPTLLSNKYIEKVELKGLNLKNAVITNLTMKNVNAMNGIFENITFESCTFMKARFDDGKFINVAFRNCKISSIDDSKNYESITTFTSSIFENVIFYNTELSYVRFDGISGNNGFVLFKNITRDKPRGEAPLFSISNAQVRVSDSIINGVIAGRKNVHAITKNSQYIEGGIYCDNNFIINTKMQDMIEAGGFKHLVIRDSVVDGDVSVNGGKGYLVNNKYLWGTRESLSGKTVTMGVGLHAKPDDSIYVVAKDNEPCSFRIFGGNVTLKGFTLMDTLIGGLFKEEPPITTLNLKDVVMQGGRWGDLRLLGGQWENVRIEPPVLVDRTSIKNLRYYRLDFPKGPPWNKKGEFVIEATENQTPFVWEEPKIPTPEDLGMVWWPKVEPGYHGN